MAVDRDAVELLVTLLVALALRADDRYEIAGAGQRARLLPDTTIERQRQILDNDQYAPALPRCHGRGAHCLLFDCHFVTNTRRDSARDARRGQAAPQRRAATAR